jgi:hypothetical protein
VNTETKQEDIQKHRKMEASTKNPATELREVQMQEEVASEDSQEETMKEDHNQASESEDMEVDLHALIVVHGEKEINSMQVGQLHRLHRELLRKQSKEPMLDNPASSSGNLGIKSNPLKNTKKPGGKERKKG